MATKQERSSDPFRQTEEWMLGDSAQKKWAKIKADEGYCVLPAYALEDVSADTKAPVLFVSRGNLVSPDLFLMRNGMVEPHEVKAKSVPTFRRKTKQWEHGVDYSLIQEYEEVERQVGSSVVIVVHETKSPISRNEDAGLKESNIWLWSCLSTIKKYGEHRPSWPGGESNPMRRGRHGKGGWLWPRWIMDQYGFDFGGW